MYETTNNSFGESDDLRAIRKFSNSIADLKKRSIIKTKNIVGDIGESLAIRHYNKDSQLPNLENMPIGTKYFDAKSEDGNRYTIKTITGKTTGVFNGLNAPNSKIPEEKKFDYVIIVVLDPNDFSPQVIYEISWDNFLVHKRWNRSKNTWSLSLTKRLKEDAEIRYGLSI
ncbi:hypothetical protein H7U05_03740 [Priestia megaterium]|uniref:DUF6998 domain-containing protein n=1 Tax=Priestia megaterium TaxID=1404 RepID=UPI001C8D5CBC|nr:hypothetical protein [Priestia megaterium]MBY0196416.1 hypothetical protein [Priestia megaterium]